MAAIQVHSEALVRFFKRQPPPLQEQIVLMHQHLEQQFRLSKGDPSADPAGIALGMHALTDEGVARQIATPDGARVTCKRGCSACCRLHVSVIEPEARLAAMAAEDAGWQIDVDRARRQASANDTDAWRELPDDLRACVFLTEAGECAIYEHRPMACRKYMVVNDPVDCDSVLKPGHEVAQLMSPDAEIAFSAALEVFEYGTLPAMLLAEIEGDAS